MNVAMGVLRYEETGAERSGVMDRVVDDRAPVVISRQGAEPVVLVSLADWRSMQETMHLLSSPRNAARLMEGIAQLNAGHASERILIEP